MENFTVIFGAARNGGVMTRVNGRIAFPDASWKPLPDIGDEWEVSVIGQNARGTVYFLAPVRRISTKGEREERERVLRDLREDGKYYRAWKVGIDDDEIVKLALSGNLDAEICNRVKMAKAEMDTVFGEGWFDKSIADSINSAKKGLYGGELDMFHAWEQATESLIEDWRHYRANLDAAKAVAEACGVELSWSLLVFTAKATNPDVIARAYRATGESPAILAHRWQVFHERTAEELITSVFRRRKENAEFEKNRAAVLEVVRRVLGVGTPTEDYDGALTYPISLPDGVKTQAGKDKTSGWWQYGGDHTFIITMHKKGEAPSGYEITRDGIRWWEYRCGMLDAGAWCIPVWYPEPIGVEDGLWLETKSREEMAALGKEARRKTSNVASAAAAGWFEGGYPMHSENREEK